MPAGNKFVVGVPIAPSGLPLILATVGLGIKPLRSPPGGEVTYLVPLYQKTHPVVGVAAAGVPLIPVTVGLGRVPLRSPLCGPHAAATDEGVQPVEVFQISPAFATGAVAEIPWP